MRRHLPSVLSYLVFWLQVVTSVLTVKGLTLFALPTCNVPLTPVCIALLVVTTPVIRSLVRPNVPSGE